MAASAQDVSSPGGDLTVQAQAQVPLREFLSSRQDQQYADLLSRIEATEKRLRLVMDERDRQYAQRFDAQRSAVNAALASAERALDKAATASEKRFDSVNEFRQTLTDQATNFMNKQTAEANFTSLQDRLNKVELLVNTIQSAGQGRADFIGWIVGIGGVLVAFGALIFNMQKAKLPEVYE
jgi:preprotein translocase subunit SecD